MLHQLLFFFSFALFTNQQAKIFPPPSLLLSFRQIDPFLITKRSNSFFPMLLQSTLFISFYFFFLIISSLVKSTSPLSLSPSSPNKSKSSSRLISAIHFFSLSLSSVSFKRGRSSSFFPNQKGLKYSESVSHDDQMNVTIIIQRRAIGEKKKDSRERERDVVKEKLEGRDSSILIQSQPFLGNLLSRLFLLMIIK